MSEESGTKEKEGLFVSFTLARLGSLELKVRERKQYKKIQARKIETYRQLEEALPKEMQADLKRFAGLWEDMAHYHSRYCYSRGFDDGTMFNSRILGKSKIGGFNIRIEPQDGG